MGSLIHKNCIARMMTGCLILTSALLPAGVARSEDIDIFKANPSTADNPNVLIVLDNSTNWSRNEQHWEVTNGGISTTQGEMELKALRTVIGELNQDVNVGLMMLTQGSGGANVDGGYIRFNIRPMDSTNKAAYQAILGNSSGCPLGANAVNGTPNCLIDGTNQPRYDNPEEKVATAQANYSNSLFEIFKYYGGYTSPLNAFSDTAGSPIDASHFGALRYSGNPDLKCDAAAYVNGATDANKTAYNPPLSETTKCAKNYVIWIGNDPNLNVDAASSLLSGVGGNTSTIALPNLVATAQNEPATIVAASNYGDYTGADEAAAKAACEGDSVTKTGGAWDLPAVTVASPPYDSLTCTLVGTQSAGGTSTITEALTSPSGNLTSNCGEYASQAACVADITARFPGKTSYSCPATGSVCTYTTALATPASLGTTGCIAAANATACVSYAGVQTTWSGYSSFNCPSAVSCGSAGKNWTVTAGETKSTGQQYTMIGTTTGTAATTAYSFKIEGSYSYNTLASAGTFSTPASNHFADEWTRFLYETDVNAAVGRQNVTTYAIDVRRLWQNAGDESKTKLLMSMARSGGGKYFNAQNANGIVNALRRILAEIQSVNSVFASSSLPVSVTEQTQSVYLNQIFIGMFRPAGAADPRWPGNLKQFKFKFFGQDLRMADKNGEEAVSSTTGFIAPCSDSFWSSDSGTYWNYPGSSAIGSCRAQASAYPTAGSTSFYSDSPDGDVVEKGGVAQKLRGVTLSGGVITTSTRYSSCASGATPSTSACRALKTCDNSTTTSCTALTNFDDANTAITQANLGVATAGDRTNLIEWVRGKDVFDEDQDGVQTEMRGSVHGGVVHSQPAVVDYGGTTGVVAFYGGDDGMFRAIDGGQTDNEGTELWGFVAPETYSRFKRIKDNEPLISYPGLGTVSPTPIPKDYFFDGSVGVFQRSGTVWIFPTMRRGGRALYAFDVTDPAAPVIKWRRGCFTSDTSDNAFCSTGWDAIGQTWSKPQIGYLTGYASSGVNKPVLVMGGGYDKCEDTDSKTRCSGTPKGSAIYFIDAATGDIIRKYPTFRSVAGDVFLMTNETGEMTHVYAADLAGSLYRINIGSYASTPADEPAWAAAGWSTNTTSPYVLAAANIHLAKLSDSNLDERKFLFGPDAVTYKNKNYVLIGSGDREHPLGANYSCNNFSGGVANQFYMVRDDVTAALPATAAVPADLKTITNFLDPDAGGTGAVSTYRGCKFDLNTCEQTVNKALTAGGITYFGTNTPQQVSGNSCASSLGTARSYAIDFEDCGVAPGQTAIFKELLGGGLPPSPVAGVVNVDGHLVPFVVGGVLPNSTKPSPLEGAKIPLSLDQLGARIYWNELYEK